MKPTSKNRHVGKITFAIVFILFIGSIFALNTFFELNSTGDVIGESSDKIEKDMNDEKNSSDVEQEEVEDKEITINLSAVGDIMFHDAQLESAYDEENDTYHFIPVFEEVKPILSKADITIGNLETTLAGPERGFSGYPLFNSPDETIDAIKNAGFDILTTANNHSLDTGIDGLQRTIKVLREKGIDFVGTADNEDQSRVLIKDVDGIKLAFLAYTESTNGLGDQYSNDQLHRMLNVMEKENIMQDIEEAKSLDADLIITYMHWGTEYMEEPNEKQIEYAHMLAEAGVDIILGSHPHVIQPSEVIETDDHETFVVYSMGNFISNQRQETVGNNRTEDGIIINFDITKNKQTNETFIENVEYVPTWVYKHNENGQSKYTYRILPIEQSLSNAEISDAFKSRMENSLKTTNAKMDHTPFEMK